MRAPDGGSGTESDAASAAAGEGDAGLAARLAALARAAPRADAVAVAAVAGEARAAVGGDGVFEAGSLTKTFTALLLADAHRRGELSLTDPLARHLPARAGGATLLHLATHTAGLPRLPLRLYARAVPRWWTAPYAAYTSGDLLRDAARVRPRRRPGRRYRYSNFGVALLGHALERATGQDYATLLARRVCEPLGLLRTTAVPAAPARVPPPPGLVPGRRRVRVVPPMTCHGLPAACGVHTTAPDLLRLLRAHLDPAAAPPALAGALREAVRPRLARPFGRDRIALVWNVRTLALPGGPEVYFHSGATRGFTAFAGFCPAAGVALAALANTTVSPGDRFVAESYLLLRALVAERPGRPGERVTRSSRRRKREGREEREEWEEPA